MALHDLNRSNDTPVSTLKVADITPVNWHRFPPRIADITDSNSANEGKPRYLGAGATSDWAGGVRGDDTDIATATVSIARSDGGANEADYTPRTQAAKATQQGNTLAVDIARPRGWISPEQSLAAAGSAPAVAPVVTSIAPTTGAATVLPMTVTITGTGFTPWSVVRTGGSETADVSGTYVSPTQMKVAIYKASAGTVSVAVEDHNLLSNTDKVFTVT